MTDYGKPQDTPFARKIGLVKPNMIERVAREIHDAMEAFDVFDDARDEWMKGARAAIAAMRECTPAMLDAGAAAHPRGYTRETMLTDIIEAEWRVMCDAALECSTKQTEK